MFQGGYRLQLKWKSTIYYFLKNVQRRETLREYQQTRLKF